MSKNRPTEEDSGYSVVRPPVTTIGLLRHGKTLWNEKKKIQGSSDSPLTAEGKQLVTHWADILGPSSWQRIITSNLGRAQATAAILNQTLNLPLSTDSRLREQDWGEWEEQTILEIQDHSPEVLRQQVSAGWNFRAPGGESRLEVLHRSLQAITDATSQWPGEHILIVTHQGVIQSLIYHLEGRKFLPTEKKLLHKNCIHTLQHQDMNLHISKLNSSLSPCP